LPLGWRKLLDVLQGSDQRVQELFGGHKAGAWASPAARRR
jgi:hypothetical protein